MAYNPPLYTTADPPITLEPAAGQSVADYETPLYAGTNKFSSNDYFAPASWCETYTLDMSECYRLKAGYLTPDALLGYRLGNHTTEPAAAQLDPVDLSDFVAIQPHADRGHIKGHLRPMWYGKAEATDGNTVGDGAIPPESWINRGDMQTDRLSGDTFYSLKDGYLTPGLLDLYERNAVQEVTAPTPTADANSYTLPAGDGVESWDVDGTPTEPGTYTVVVSDADVTVTVLPIAAAGYSFVPAAEPTVFTFAADPAPPDPGDGEEYALTIMRKLLGSDLGDDELSSAYGIVRLFVKEYTRGRGFDGDRPTDSLIAVIITGAARLASNPEQAIAYSLDNMSIRPAVFNGYTLAEQRVLSRYRRVWA